MQTFFKSERVSYKTWDRSNRLETLGWMQDTGYWMLDTEHQHQVSGIYTTFALMIISQNLKA
jgi:hypothetical protein